MKSLKRKFLAIIGFCLSLSLLAFFASCGENKITVEFATNGGSEIASVELDAGAECAAPQTPVKAGYEFAGWYDNEALSGAAVVFPVTLNENATYYAKWTKLYTLTLDAAGGSVSTGSITLKAGASVSDAIKNLTPEYAHREFAGWYNGAGKVSSGLSMPAADLTLTAKYKVEYSVEIYLQAGKDSSAYQQSETVKGYEFAGTSFTASVKKEGYKAVSKPETVATKTISENYQENIYRLYYDIECYDIEFSAAYPDGSNATRTYSLSYGEDMDAPYDIFEAQGYVLAGWADESGKLKYKVDYLNAVAVNGEGGKAIVDKISVKSDTYLTAVWSKGLKDFFGGNDAMYISATSDVVYLERGGLYFKGDIFVTDDGNKFEYRNKNGNTMLEGKFVDAEGNAVTEATIATSVAAFEIKNDDRDTRTYNLYKVGQGVEQNTSIILDAYNGITYSARLQLPSEGLYYIDDNGYLVVKYASGPKSGKEETMMLSEADDGTRTFRIRNEEELALGVIPRGIVYEGEVYTIKTEYGYWLKMDGFGNAVYSTSEEEIDFTYSKVQNTENEYTLLVNGNEIGQIRLASTDKGGKYYMFYEEEYNHVYKVGENATLTIDGFNGVTYTDGDKTVVSHYGIDDSVFGGNIIYFKDKSDNTDYVFLISAITNDGVAEESGQSGTEYVAERKESNYQEFYFKDGMDIYYAPLVVYNGKDGEDIVAEIYMRTTAASYVKVSVGTVAENAAGRMVYTETEKMTVEETTWYPFDFSGVKAFEFEVDDTTVKGKVYYVNYWYSYTENDGRVVKTTIEFEGDDGVLSIIVPFNPEKQSLQFSNIGIYDNGTGKLYKGEYTVKTDGSIVLVCTERVKTSEGTVTHSDYFYFRLESEGGATKLVTLKSEPYSAAVKVGGGDYVGKYMYFDGREGKATLYLFDEATGELLENGVYEGEFAENGTTAYGDRQTVYTFTADGITSFDFIITEEFSGSFKVIYAEGAEKMFAAGDKVVSLYNEEYYGAYASEEGEALRLDGYGYYGEYIGSGVTVKGKYIAKDGAVSITDGNGTHYFDLKGGTSFTARGEEARVYIQRTNNFNSDIFYELDGYGNLKVYIASEGTIERYIDEDGTYVYDAETKSVTFDYEADGAAVTERGILTTYRDGGLLRPAFTPYSDEAAGIYLSAKNWAVLILGSDGKGVWYDENGGTGKGSYTLITEDMLCFTDESGDGHIYTYDVAKKTITTIKLEGLNYYTADFNSLVFSRSGYVVYNGNKEYFYSQQDGKVVIYKQTGNGKYGFEEDLSFGDYLDDKGDYLSEKDYGGEHYIRSEGLQISFKRDLNSGEHFKLALGEDKLEIGDLSFTPPGTTEFEFVVGDIKVGANRYDCHVTRKDGKMHLIFYLEDDRGNLGEYDIYIDATFGGNENSTYRITGIERSQTIYANNYLTNYFLYYYYFGASAASSYKNEFGTIKIVEILDEDCEVVDYYAEGEFGSASAFYDYDGNPLGFKAKYEQPEVEGLPRGTNYYVVTYTADDGMKYNVYFITANHPYMGAKAYIVNLFGREETLTTGDGVYEVTVERVAASDRGYKIGALSRIVLKKNGEEVDDGAIAILDGSVYYIVRNTDGSAVYYKIDIELENTGFTGEDKLLKIEKVTVTELTAETYKTEDEESFVDIVGGRITVLSVVEGKEGRKNYLVSACEYDEESGVYTVTTVNGQYTVKIEGGKAVIEKVEEEPEKPEEPIEIDDPIQPGEEQEA